jgi:hypothetical protein
LHHNGNAGDHDEYCDPGVHAYSICPKERLASSPRT